MLIFTYISNASKFPRARWLYDFTVTSYEVQWYSFWYQWTEEVHTYTLVANRPTGVSGVPYRKYREGVATTPLRRTCYQKYFRSTRGLCQMPNWIFWSNLFCAIDYEVLYCKLFGATVSLRTIKCARFALKRLFLATLALSSRFALAALSLNNIKTESLAASDKD